MTYSKKNIFNKLSITKNQAWLLILNAKSIYKANGLKRKTITIKKNNYSFVYDFTKKKIIRKNFSSDDAIQELFDIFLPIILNNNKEPYVIGHLAQSLDGFIATNSGESKYISCKQNIEHIHRIRAISDVILVGAKTILYDNPMLTTRLVKGNNPMRLVLDPRDKIRDNKNIFKNPDKNSFKIIGMNKKNKNEKSFRLPTLKNNFKANNLLKLFKKLNKRIIFIEGGGYTISNFYESNLLNRFHLCLSPILIGQGKNSFLIKGKRFMRDFKNHKINYYEMGKDILCDIDLTT
ncbi:MAG: hypothetical protein CMD49_04530 [Gammaproteobacteria bacterium]|nr:hypothetical protein [Gammaproteobacteria bacterium]|tara:strand:- start:1074 stop:1949 length:876 start_codon:yes stop_codon:yes gene_type:complete